VIARCHGANNSGQVVVANEGSFAFNLLPSGMCTDRCLNVIGNGVVVNLDALFKVFRFYFYFIYFLINFCKGDSKIF
jgi:adenylosuccinate synthase